MHVMTMVWIVLAIEMLVGIAASIVAVRLNATRTKSSGVRAAQRRQDSERAHVSSGR